MEKTLFNSWKGLISKQTNPPYTKEQKLRILTELKNGVSKRRLTAKYLISHSTLSRWMLRYQYMGKFDPTKAITPDEIKSLKKENKDNPTMMELLERLEYSEMENACLKKLATLVQARKEKNQKQSKN